MPTSGIPGFTGQMFMSTAAAATSSAATNAIAELRDVTLTLEMEPINAFSKDSSGWDENIAGKRSWGGSGTAIYKDTTGSTGQALVFDAINNRATYGATFRAASSSGIVQYHGGIIVTQFEVQSPTEDVHQMNFSFRGTGALVRAASTS